MPAARKSSTVAAKPQRCILYGRISDDNGSNGNGAGVRDQEADLRDYAHRLGWEVGRVIVENDTSAFKRKKVLLPNGERALRVVRPGWRSMLDDLASGRADGLLAVDLDRAARDPRDLEDLIDVVESKVPRVPVESVSGSLKLANDGDVTMARVLVAVANKSSRDTSRRVSRARLRQATEGRFGGGARRYGHELDGTLRAVEAAVLAQAAEAVLSGVGLAGIVKDLNARGVPAIKAKRWSHQSLRDMLLQSRTAGLMAFDGEILEDVEACWQPIIDRPTWEAVVTVLNSPGRRTTPGPTPKHLLSHLARCGHPSHPDDDRPVLTKGSVGGNKGAPRIPAYRCSGTNHLAVAQAPLDAYVTAVVIERLSRPDAAELLVPRSDVDVAGLAREANSLRARLTSLGDLVETGDMSTGEFRTRKARLTEQLGAIEAELSASAGTSPLVGIAGHPDAAAVWEASTLAEKRAVIDALMTITVLSATSLGRGFNAADRVRLGWRAPV
jgi:site-specific DNA recombinase